MAVEVPTKKLTRAQIKAQKAAAKAKAQEPREPEPEPDPNRKLTRKEKKALLRQQKEAETKTIEAKAAAAAASAPKKKLSKKAKAALEQQRKDLIGGERVKTAGTGRAVTRWHEQDGNAGSSTPGKESTEAGDEGESAEDPPTRRFAGKKWQQPPLGLNSKGQPIKKRRKKTRSKQKNKRKDNRPPELRPGGAKFQPHSKHGTSAHQPNEVATEEAIDEVVTSDKDTNMQNSEKIRRAGDHVAINAAERRRSPYFSPQHGSTDTKSAPPPLDLDEAASADSEVAASSAGAKSLTSRYGSAIRKSPLLRATLLAAAPPPLALDEPQSPVRCDSLQASPKIAKSTNDFAKREQKRRRLAEHIAESYGVKRQTQQSARIEVTKEIPQRTEKHNHVDSNSTGGDKLPTPNSCKARRAAKRAAFFAAKDAPAKAEASVKVMQQTSGDAWDRRQTAPPAQGSCKASGIVVPKGKKAAARQALQKELARVKADREIKRARKSEQKAAAIKMDSSKLEDKLAVLEAKKLAAASAEEYEEAAKLKQQIEVLKVEMYQSKLSSLEANKVAAAAAEDYEEAARLKQQIVALVNASSSRDNSQSASPHPKKPKLSLDAKIQLLDSGSKKSGQKSKSKAKGRQSTITTGHQSKDAKGDFATGLGVKGREGYRLRQKAIKKGLLTPDGKPLAASGKIAGKYTPNRELKSRNSHDKDRATDSAAAPPTLSKGFDASPARGLSREERRARTAAKKAAAAQKAA